MGVAKADTPNGVAEKGSKIKSAGRLTKNQKRRLKRKEKKKENQSRDTTDENVNGKPEHESKVVDVTKPDVEIEYVSAKLSGDDPAVSEFSQVFEKFLSAEELCGTADADEKSKDEAKEKEEDKPVQKGDSDSDSDDEDNKLSRKQRKKLKRLSVAELKQLVNRPDVVEAHDVTAADPRFLVHIKAMRNTVEVPRHWCHKRKYLQGKRGVEKPPFKLPDFISQTGIEKIRGAAAELDELKGRKAKQRERMAPKLGRVDIDYQILHDAFFKFQTKPKLSMVGDLYYEGKEFEVKLTERKPGHLSDELKKALGMSDTSPPPWLINMQRYGPPPSYPNLKIPGLNAPIPEGASFGYHAGGWGKPPVDEYGRPLYGDVFGVENINKAHEEQTDQIEKTLWAEELEEESEEEEEESEDEEMEADNEEVDMEGLETPVDEGVSSIASGLETPESVELRKGPRSGLETPETPELYKVIEQKETNVGTGLYGSSHAYVLPSSSAGKSKAGDGVAVTLDVTDLENMDEETLKMKYDEQMEAQRQKKEDVSDVMEEQERKRKRKLKSAESKKKGYKDFKF